MESRASMCRTSTGMFWVFSPESEPVLLQYIKTRAIGNVSHLQWSFEGHFKKETSSRGNQVNQNLLYR